MTIHWILWAWLNRVVRHAMDSVGPAGVVRRKDWNCRLAGWLYSNLHGRAPVVTVSSALFIKNMDDKTYVITRSSHRPYTSKHEDILRFTEVCLRQVISAWMGFPAEGTVHLAQSELIGWMLLHGGSNVVYLPSAVYAYQHIRSTLSLDRRAPISHDALSSFRLALATHPISDIGSDERQTLDAIGALFSASKSHAAITTVTGTYRVQAGLHGFVEFLRYLLPVIEMNGEEPEFDEEEGGADDRLRLMVLGNMDLYLPFREHLPSVRAVRAEDGPFSSDHWQSRSGFFSALVFRAITCASPAVLDGYVMFDTLEQFQHFCDAHPDEPEYLCNTAPYRTPNPKRSPECVDKLWEISSRWEELLAPTTNEKVDPANPYSGYYSLTEFFDVLQSLRIPNVGSLGCYLLAADYAYTPLVKMPDYGDMANMVHRLNKGALGGLQDLGLLPAGNHHFPQQDVYDAFLKAARFLDDNLTDEEMDEMVFDAIMIENALCKYRRLHIARRGLILPDVSRPR